MGGAINRSFISAHFLLSAYFLTAQTYKHMRLITRVYGKRSVVGYINNNYYSDTNIGIMEIAEIVSLARGCSPTHIHRKRPWSDVAFWRYPTRNTSVQKLQLCRKNNQFYHRPETEPNIEGGPLITGTGSEHVWQAIILSKNCSFWTLVFLEKYHQTKHHSMWLPHTVAARHR